MQLILVKMAAASVVCAICRVGNLLIERYRLLERAQRGGGAKELYCQLRTVVGAGLPVRLRSEFMCVLVEGASQQLLVRSDGSVDISAFQFLNSGISDSLQFHTYLAEYVTRTCHY